MPTRPIALVLDYSPDYLGGAQVAFERQLAVLAADGRRVIVVAPPSGRLARECRRLGVVFVPVRPRMTVPGLDLPLVPNTPSLRAGLRDLFIHRSIGAVHVHSELGLAAAAISAARQTGAQVLHTVHTFFWRAAPGTQHLVAAALPLLHRVVTRQHWPRRHLAARCGDSALRNLTLSTALRADVVISPSAHQAERLREAGVPRVHVLPNTTARSPEGRPLRRVTGPLRVAWVGRADPEKRLRAFLDGVGIAHDVLGPGRLVVDVVGDGSDLATARARMRSDAEVRFHGRLPNAEVARVLRDAHLGALSSFGFDNQPMTVVESITAARGMLYCDPALREGLDEAGILIDGPEAVHFAAALVELAMDPRRVVEASAAAVRAASGFAPAVFLEGLDEALTAASPGCGGDRAGHRRGGGG